MPDDALLRTREPAFRRRPPATIGAFEVRAASNELAGPQGVLRLRPRLMDVLLRLAVAPGEVVPRQVLLDDVWPRRLVADEVLSRTIAELRTALADDAREARYIETLPKVGYRLIARVTAAPETGVSASAAAATDSATATPAATTTATATAVRGAPLAAEDGTPRAADARSSNAPDAGSSAAPDAGSSAAPGAGSSAAPDAAHGIATAAMSARARRRRRWMTAGAAALVAAGAATVLLRQPPDDPLAALQWQLTNAVPFSSDLEMEQGPRFSRAGDRIAFTLGTMDRAQIVVQDVATRSRRVIGEASGNRRFPVFFPDGERLAYYRKQGSDCALVERGLDADTERVLVDCTDNPGARFDLSPDGRRLVYASLRDGAAGLRLLDLASGRVTTLTQPAADAGVDVFPRFSPDGTRVAYFRGQSSGREIWIVPVAAPAEARPVGSPRALAWGLAWLDDETRLLVAADWLGFRALNVFDLRTGKPTLAGARGAQFPDVGPRGEIVFEAASYQANLKLVDPADPAQPPRTLWPSARYSNYPRFSPDGTKVAFLSNRDNTASLFVGTIGGELRRLPLPTEYVFARPQWSHDGRMLYAVRSRAEASDVPPLGVRIDVDSGRVEVLSALGDDIFDVRESADGRTLYFGTGVRMQLWRAPVGDPAAREKLPLPLAEEYDVRGNRLAYSEPQSSDLTVCTLPDLQCAPAELPQKPGVVGWALGNDAVWLGYWGEPGELVRFDLATHAITTRVPLGPSAIGPNLAVSGDERQVVVARQEPPAIDLMLGSGSMLARQPAR